MLNILIAAVISSWICFPVLFLYAYCVFLKDEKAQVVEVPRKE
ncbi:hypothetical protein [Planococcus wigleyi]|nr:hypothetical protein [Planococcus wigleyi]